jgi:signal transduction histidine kinase
VLVLLLIVIFFVSYTIYYTQKKFLTEQIQFNTDTSFKLLLNSCKEALKINKEAQIVEAMVSIYEPAIVYAYFVSENNDVFVSKNNAASVFISRANASSVYKSEKYESLTGENIYEYSSPIMSNDQYIGTFIVGFSQDYIDSRINEGISVIIKKIKRIAIISILLSILGANFVLALFIKPIRLLGKAAKKISEGDMSAKVDVKDSGEIGQLAKAFNGMITKIKETDNFKDEFISSVSHELRTPLSAIDGYCNLLIRAIGKNYSHEQQLKGLNIIKEATARLTKFINSVLDLSKMKTGIIDLKMVPVHIEEVIKETVNLFESLATAQDKHLVYKVQNNLLTVNGNIEKIKKVITNILENAFKFTRVGDTVTVNTMLSPSYGNEYIEVWIADTGIGISKEDVERVFEKFYQVKEGKYKKPKGTGLGLSIAYEIVKLHHGNIWAESEIGKGTVFKFVLPVLKL